MSDMVERISARDVELARPDAEAVGVPPEAWAALEIAMGSPWHGRGIPSPRDTTRAAFEALKRASFAVVPVRS